MNRKQFFKLYILIFIVLYSEFNLANQEMFVPLPLSGTEQKKECPRVGAISGRINISDNGYFNPDNYKNIVIRVAGVNYSKPESLLYEYYPNEDGCFSIQNNFHLGSSLLLYIWDTNSKYYYKTINAYVGLKTNYYDISVVPFEDVIYTSEAFSKKLNNNIDPIDSNVEEIPAQSNTFNPQDSTQSLNNAGLCGYAIGLPPGDIMGTKISMTNARGKRFSAKYYNNNNFPSSKLNKLSMSGHFCFFNLNSCNEYFSECTDNSNYKLSFNLKNGENKDFDLIIPNRTFSDSSVFDLNAAIYRPVQLYSIKDFSTNNWTKTLDVEVNMSKGLINNESLKGLQYFPVGDDIVKIDYKTSSTEKDRYFLLKPRAEIFSYDILSSIKDYTPGEIFVDKNNLVNIKIFDPNALNLSKDYLAPLYNTNTGSVFFSFDLAKYNSSINSIKLEIRNVYGALVRSTLKKNIYDNETYDSSLNLDDFNINGLNDLKVLHSNYDSLNGFIYNLKPGYYQLFVKSKTSDGKEDILYTTLVQSFVNKTQVITDFSDEPTSVTSDVSKPYVLANADYSNYDVTVIPWDQSTYDSFLNSDLPHHVILPNNADGIRDLNDEKLFVRSNIFNMYSTDVLCGYTMLNKTIELPQHEIKDELYFDFIPKVNLLPNEFKI